MQLPNYRLVRLDNLTDVSLFDCDNIDLNDFIKNDALSYQEELLSATYLWMDNNQTPMTFISLSNDKIIKSENISFWNNICRIIPNNKRRKHYPAVLLQRLGVSKNLQKTGLGSEVITFLKAWFTNKNKTGCRFIVVDAYNEERALNFYKKNGFKFLSNNDQSNHTRHMYFDLMIFKTKK